MENFRIVQKQNYTSMPENGWRDIEKYQMRKYLVIDDKSKSVISDFSDMKKAQKLTRHLNKGDK